MENDKVIECLYDISTDAIYCITTEESEAIQTSIKAIEKLDKIEQIIDDCDLEAWEVLEMIKKVLEQDN